ncbi:hypothetical protein WISP_83344 [Willisornis vidua]|uniref:Protein phosphatase 1 regulatory subunit 21 n=1 Tax=Willisornis vidua TaxID=1566151 RepID=A0ABQ9D425_9PASS|nr:hypothetical protein WISP_83344 [Willisornis vidua]
MAAAAAELQGKYQKLAQEYSKLRAQNQVLKKGVVDEQANSASLKEQLKMKDQSLRKLQQEMDSLTFRNQQLAKRVELLQDELALSEARGKKSKKSTESSSQLSQEQKSVFNEDLQKKIEENERLHILFFEADEQHKRLEAELRTRLEVLETDAAQHQAVVDSLTKKYTDAIEKLQSDKAKLEIKSQTLEREAKDCRLRTEECQQQLKNLQAALGSRLEESLCIINEKVPFNDTRSNRYNALNVPLHNRRYQLKLRDLAGKALAFVQELVTALLNFHTYTEQKVQIFPIDSATDTISPLNQKETTVKLKAFSEHLASYLCFLRKILPYQLKSLEEECESSLCTAALRARNMELHRDMKRLTSVFEKLHTYVSLLALPSTNPEGLLRTNYSFVFTNIAASLHGFHDVLKDISKHYSQKATLEQDVPTATQKLITTNDCILSSVAALTNGAGKIASFFSNNLDHFTTSLSYGPKGGTEFISPLSAECMLQYKKKAAAYMKSLKKPCADSVPYEEALANRRVLLSSTESREGLAQQVQQSLEKIAKLEQEKEHWMLEAQLAKIKLEKENQKLKNSLSGHLTETIQEHSILPNVTEQKETTEKSLREPIKSTSLIGMLTITTDNEKPPDVESREDLIKTHYMARIAELTSHLQLADSKSVHFHAEDELMTTKRSYEDQLSMMSDHLCSMNETLTKQREEIDTLKMASKWKWRKGDGFACRFESQRNSVGFGWFAGDVCASASSFSYKMCSTNPTNWVTFDDEPLFQSPQKSVDNQSSCKANGLKLNLSSVHESSSRSSSTGSTPLSSPVVDFYLSPGPPSNSPLTTPTRDYPGNPCIPKSGIHMLYPIPEWPSDVNLPSPGTCSSLALQKPSSLPLNTSPNDHPVKALVPKSADEESPNSSGNWEELAPGRFPYIQSDCAFSSPFWKEGCSLSMSPANVTMHRKDRMFDRSTCHPKDKESCHDQKSLNQGSFSYICERLEHLQADSCDTAETQPISSSQAWHRLSPTIPCSLFRSHRANGWPFMLRIPEKKNMMSSRQWGPIYLSVLAGGILQMYYEKGLEKPFKEFQLQPQCKLSEPKLESYNVSGKIHTVKIECISYTEKRKYHPKVEVIHEPEVEQMLKLGTTDYNDFTDFLVTVEEELMKLPTVSRQKRNYEEQEMTLEIVDNFWGKVTKAEGKLVESAVITHIYCLCFVNGGADCFLTLNDIELQKRDERYFDKEEEKKWIDILDYHFHNCVKVQEFEQSRIIKFTPLDACRLELMRFRTRYNGQDLPFSMKAAVVVQGAYIELQAFINMSSTALNPTCLPCENIMIRFPVPTQWIKALWTMNLQRQKSLKAKMNRRACLGALHEVESDPVIQVSVGTAKYESAYRAVVWKIDRLPDKNSTVWDDGGFKDREAHLNRPHSTLSSMTGRGTVNQESVSAGEMGLDTAQVEQQHIMDKAQISEFVVHDTRASGTEVKSLGLESDLQPQKHVVQKAFYNCQVEIEKKWIRLDGEDPDKAGNCLMQ